MKCGLNIDFILSLYETFSLDIVSDLAKQ